MSAVAYYFGLPRGQIWPNLLASLLCVGVAWWRLRVQAIAHHAELKALAAIHHAELKAHVTATVATPRAARCAAPARTRRREPSPRRG